MTTLEFMQKELRKCQVNLEQQIARNAPPDNIENIKAKISHYEEACEALKGSESK
jgi:hypothetical protein